MICLVAKNLEEKKMLELLIFDFFFVIFFRKQKLSVNFRVRGALFHQRASDMFVKWLNYPLALFCLLDSVLARWIGLNSKLMIRPLFSFPREKKNHFLFLFLCNVFGLLFSFWMQLLERVKMASCWLLLAYCFCWMTIKKIETESKECSCIFNDKN